MAVIGMLTTACDWFGGTQPDNVVARVNEQYLYRSQLSDLVPEGSSADDSGRLVKAYVESWIREELLLAEAKKQLSARSTAIDQKLEDYRRSLLIYSLEDEIMASQMDTAIDPQLIESYFDLNKAQFLLRDPILKGRYVKVENGAPKTDLLRRLLVSKRSKDEKLLADYCLQYATNYQLNDSSWMYAEEVLRSMPRDKMQEVNYNSRSLFETSDEQFQYFVVVNSFRDVGQEPPLEIERNNIRDLILLQRRQQAIARYIDEMYQRAELDQKFEIYP
jgi:hypothetical protein